MLRPAPTATNSSLGDRATHRALTHSHGIQHICRQSVCQNQPAAVFAQCRKKERCPRSIRDQSSDKSIVWEYTAENSNRPIWTFFSHYLSGAQHQPIGNTLICEGSNGRIFEVTSAEEIVWEYVHPFPNRTPKIPNATIFRAAKVPETWLKR
jgi:hypothetical protein